MTKHKIIFEMNVDDKQQWHDILNNVENLHRTFVPQTTEIEVIVHGAGLGLLLKTNTSMHQRLQLVADSGVRFAGCEYTLRSLDLKLEDLMSFATTVDYGAAEVLRKKQAGWTYINCDLQTG